MNAPHGERDSRDATFAKAESNTGVRTSVYDDGGHVNYSSRSSIEFGMRARKSPRHSYDILQTPQGRLVAYTHLGAFTPQKCKDGFHMSNDPKTSHGFDRRRVLQSMFAAAVAPAALSSLRSAGAQDAAALLKQSATAMAALQSFAFSMSTVQGKSVLLGNLELQAVDGVVQRPDRFKADITLGASIVSVTVKVIGIGADVWVTNPLSADETFIKATSGEGDSSADTLASLLNPDRLFLAAVEAIQSPAIAGTEQVDGVDTTKISGTVDLSTLAAVSAIATPTADQSGSIAGFINLGPKTVTAWIDASGLVHRIQVAGPFTKDESNDVIREIALTKFNDPQDVQPPTKVAQ